MDWGFVLIVRNRPNILDVVITELWFFITNMLAIKIDQKIRHASKNSRKRFEQRVVKQQGVTQTAMECEDRLYTCDCANIHKESCQSCHKKKWIKQVNWPMRIISVGYRKVEENIHSHPIKWMVGQRIEIRTRRMRQTSDVENDRFRNDIDAVLAATDVCARVSVPNVGDDENTTTIVLGTTGRK